MSSPLSESQIDEQERTIDREIEYNGRLVNIYYYHFYYYYIIGDCHYCPYCHCYHCCIECDENLL